MLDVKFSTNIVCLGGQYMHELDKSSIGVLVRTFTAYELETIYSKRVLREMYKTCWGIPPDKMLPKAGIVLGIQNYFRLAYQ